MAKCRECENDMESKCEFCGKLICDECDVYVQDGFELYSCVHHDFEVIAVDLLKKKDSIKFLSMIDDLKKTSPNAVGGQKKEG